MAWKRREHLRRHPELLPPADGRLGVWIFTPSRQPDPGRPAVFVPLPLEVLRNGPAGEAAR